MFVNILYIKKNNSFNEYNVYNDNLYCHYCSKQCKNLNSLKQHEIRCKKKIQSTFNLHLLNLIKNVELGIKV